MDRLPCKRAVMEKLLDDVDLLNSATQAESLGFLPVIEGQNLSFVHCDKEFDGWEVNL